MAATLFSRSLRSSTLPTGGAGFICQSCKRQQSSYRRTRKALTVKPHPAFLPSKTEMQDHIIFNPPSSAPSVYHTPMKFLPPSDPRRKLPPPGARPATTPSSAPGTASTTSAPARRLPPVRPEYTKRYHLQQEQIDEIRQLRTTDPRRWTRVRLAEKFQCSQFFVSLVVAAPREIRDQRLRDLEEIKRKWGRRKTEAREARQLRKKLWGRDL